MNVKKDSAIDRLSANLEPHFFLELSPLGAPPFLGWWVSSDTPARGGIGSIESS